VTLTMIRRVSVRGATMIGGQRIRWPGSVVLEEAGYMQVCKGAVGRRPRTWFRLTAQGRQALEGHLAQLEEAVSASSRDVTQATASTADDGHR
jgi:hypothetical protein